MRKANSVIMKLALTAIMSGIFFQATLLAYVIDGSTVTLTASDRTSDNTVLIQGFLNNTAYTKIIIQPGTNNASWLVKPLFFKHDNTEVHLEANAVLEEASGYIANDRVLDAKRRSNIQVTGDPGSKILMHKENGVLCYALMFRSCSNVTISGVTLENAGGDGIYLGGATETEYCDNVTINNIVVDGVSRNGLTVLSVDGLTVTGCMFKNAQVQAGIGFEPNVESQQLKNIVINNCTILNNNGFGIYIGGSKLGNSDKILSITVKNCIVQGNEGYGILVSSILSSLDNNSSIAFQNCVISDNKQCGVFVRAKSKDAGTLSFTDCYLRNNNLAAGNEAFLIYNSLGYEVCGNIQLNNIVIEQPTNRSVDYFLRIRAESADGIENVSGNIYYSDGLFYNSNTININIVTALNAPQSRWKMDETSGSIACDSNGACNGTLVNNPAWTRGRLGGGLSLNGTNQFVTIPNASSLNIEDGNFSISLWMQRSDDVATNKRLLYKGASSNSEMGYALSGSNTSLNLVLCNGVSRIITYCPIPGLNQWHHIVFTVDRVSGKTKTYLNGIYQAGQDKDISSYSGVNITNTRNLLIGASTSGGVLAWPGKVDDVRIYKRTLTDGEVSDLASSASAHWCLNEGNGNTAADSIGRSAGVLQNSPAWTSGILGGALALNGINQFMTISNNSSDLNIGTGDFSISLWMQRSSTDETFRRLLDKGASTTSDIGYALVGSSNSLSLVLCDGSSRLSVSSPILILNQWYHVVFTADRSNNKAISYLNGVYQAETDISAYSGADISNSKDLLIGAASSSGTLAWPGKVDDVRIYQRVLSATEAVQLYSATP